MKLQWLILILAYFGIYLLVLTLYWAFKYWGGCAGELACVFDEDRILGILTITSYMLTPALGIGGFLSWKIQHNRGLLAEDAKHIFLAVNNDLKNLKQLQYLLKQQSQHANISDLAAQINHTYQEIRRANLDIYADALVLYEMSNDENLAQVRDAYHDAGLELLQQVKPLTNNDAATATPELEKTLEHKKQLNHQFKQILRQYIIFK